MDLLLNDIRTCTFCEEHLEAGARPVVQIGPSSKVLIIGQAPGRRVHETGIPWNDASGKTLRKWLNIGPEEFYDPQLFSIMGMGFCYPGKGKSGDLPPMRPCAGLWHGRILETFRHQPLVLLIGQYAQRYYLRNSCKGSLTDTVRAFREYAPSFFPLPHPSPRNQNWLKVNPWFMEDVIPDLRARLELLGIRPKGTGDTLIDDR